MNERLGSTAKSTTSRNSTCKYSCSAVAARLMSDGQSGGLWLNECTSWKWWFTFKSKFILVRVRNTFWWKWSWGVCSSNGVCSHSVMKQSEQHTTKGRMMRATTSFFACACRSHAWDRREIWAKKGCKKTSTTTVPYVLWYDTHTMHTWNTSVGGTGRTVASITLV